MSVTLATAHALEQVLQTRHPLCRVFSCENVPSIPFDGDFLTSLTVNEQYPHWRAHSTNRLYGAYSISPRTIRYGYTDTDRSQFTFVDFVLTSVTLGEVSVCEMGDTNILLVWEETLVGTRYVKYKIISVDGAIFDPDITGTIFSQSSSLYFTGPFVSTMTDGSYLLVYGTIDGTHYHLYRRTSADGVTWSAASEIDLSGLDDTLRKANPHVLVHGTGDIWLLFDYLESVGPSGEELTNVYYVSSSDKLATCSAETALTSYPTYGARAEHPAACLKTSTSMYLAFDKVIASLSIDVDSDGWCGAQSIISNMHIDVAAQKLYVTAAWMGAGHKQFYCVAKIDLATWEIDKCWSTTTSPAFPSIFAAGKHTWWDSAHSEGAYVAVGIQDGVVSVLNADTDDITTYSFYDFYSYGVAQNINWEPASISIDGYLSKVWVDAATSRIYLLFIWPIYHASYFQVGYIDLTDSPDETGKYDFHEVLNHNTRSDFADTFEAQECVYGLYMGNGFMEINTGQDWIILSSESAAPGNWKGYLFIFSLSTGGLWKLYSVDSNPTFPYNGLHRGMYHEGKIVGDFEYESLYGQSDYRGLCIIDVTTDVITYSRPSWASVNDYQLGDIAVTDDDVFILAAGTNGVTLFDGTTWSLTSNSNFPGLTPNGQDYFINPIAYNPSTRMIISGCGYNYYTSGWAGVIMFSRDGYIKQSQYMIGTYVTGWSWSTIDNLVQGYNDYQASICIDPVDNGLFAFWTNKYSTELSIKWDKEMPSFELTDYLLRGEAVERSSSLDVDSGSWDCELKFTVSHGHLFDPSNNASLWRNYCMKGRAIQQQFGDLIGGVQYYEPVKILTISHDGEIDYERSRYPVMMIEAESIRRRWDKIHITASKYYTDQYPEYIIQDLLVDFGGIDLGNISLGTWSNRAQITYQFVDVSLEDAVDLVAYHFGYAIRVGSFGIIEAVKITDAAAAVRAYTDQTKLRRASPRNNNCSFVNQWTVRCEERTFTELLMAEEQAAELNASHRWNTGTKEYQVNYTHGDKIYRNPRLEVLDSVSSLAFSLAGGCDEALIDNSHDESDQTLWDTYCTIEVSSPDLTPEFIACLAGIVASYFVGDVVAWSHTIPVGSYIRTFLIVIALNILAATGNFNYNIHGQPVVKVRRQLQATADDLEDQVKMGQVLSDSPYDDPLCGSPSECQAVADFLKMVGMAEKKRWSATIIPDLRNEEGDTISVIHPVSEQTVTVFLTDVSITYTIPNIDDENGAFEQSFEGWRR
jgi:hypothetical protein